MRLLVLTIVLLILKVKVLVTIYLKSKKQTETFVLHYGGKTQFLGFTKKLYLQTYLEKCTETGRNSCYLCSQGSQQKDQMFRYTFLNKVVPQFVVLCIIINLRVYLDSTPALFSWRFGKIPTGNKKVQPDTMCASKRVWILYKLSIRRSVHNQL